MGCKVSTGNAQELKKAMTAWLKEFPGEVICPRQIWYEGLDGCGVPNPAEMEAMEAVLLSLGDWKNIGNQRYEKFGAQNSWKRVK
jgi:hypothetical protein